MSFWTAMVAIVAIIAFTEMRKAKYYSQKGIVEENGRMKVLETPVNPAREAELERELEGLRERVKVLERIATDTETGPGLTRRQLAEEIEALRGK